MYKIITDGSCNLSTERAQELDGLRVKSGGLRDSYREIAIPFLHSLKVKV